MTPDEEYEFKQYFDYELLQRFNNGQISIYCNHCNQWLTPEIPQDFKTCIHCGSEPLIQLAESQDA
jgi:hypothetical protein